VRLKRRLRRKRPVGEKEETQGTGKREATQKKEKKKKVLFLGKIVAPTGPREDARQDAPTNQKTVLGGILAKKAAKKDKENTNKGRFG